MMRAGIESRPLVLVYHAPVGLRFRRAAFSLMNLVATRLNINRLLVISLLELPVCVGVAKS